MTNERARTVARWLSGVLTLAAVSGLGAGTAYADEYNTASHNGPRIGLVNVGQVDDPMEDVLEHVLLIGDGYTWR
ncbi:hypothetical protein [Streptomyces sp. V4I2]|uniref:hypothetical protein n=1 Tax=Streptomyces sp. V4I2 TaxID=3042280 RepID=UPI002788527B|nr:hypothetical protein [Streptomyces sp. V4I2]MDQ1044497.1 hypothetical protein [Streptomyces sp. V4I2]